jgi:hypothetical protein
MTDTNIGLAKAITKELNVNVLLVEATKVHAVYKRNSATPKLALGEAIKFILRKECTLEQSNNILTALAEEGIFL